MLLNVYEVKQKLPPVNRADDANLGGKYIMSLALGETVYMLHKDTKLPGYYVVMELVKDRREIKFKAHWDARRDSGEKDDSQKLILGSKREEIVVSALALKELAPPGFSTPVKIQVDPLGQWQVLEPFQTPKSTLTELDPRVIAVAREAIQYRLSKVEDSRSKKHKKTRFLGLDEATIKEARN